MLRTLIGKLVVLDNRLLRTRGLVTSISKDPSPGIYLAEESTVGAIPCRVVIPSAGVDCIRVETSPRELARFLRLFVMSAKGMVLSDLCNLDEVSNIN